jgi:hypothetical protein
MPCCWRLGGDPAGLHLLVDGRLHGAPDRRHHRGRDPGAGRAVPPPRADRAHHVGRRAQRPRPGGAGSTCSPTRLQPLVGNIDTWPTAEPDDDGWIDFRLRERTGQRRPRTAPNTPPAPRCSGCAAGLRLLVGRDVRELAATRDLIQDALAWGLAITAALALLGGWLMSAGVVRRHRGHQPGRPRDHGGRPVPARAHRRQRRRVRPARGQPQPHARRASRR